MFKQRFLLEGVMPERALLRLQRAGIAVYDVQKPQKNRLAFSVKAKDGEKVFAIYPKTWYNKNVYSAYTLTFLGNVGLYRAVKAWKNRIGITLGALLCFGVCTYADGMIFGVQVTGATDYTREALSALQRNGVRLYATYEADKKVQSAICADILSCDGVEFCSVQKAGLWLRVEIRKGTFSTSKRESGDMRSLKEGKIIAMRVLSGTPLKTSGDEVHAGETLVGAWFLKADGDTERKATEVIACAEIESAFAGIIQAENKESAFCRGFLEAGLQGEEKILSHSVTDNGDGTFNVRITYTFTQRWNL